MFVSQPFDAVPSQSPKPELQLGTQAPAVQAVVPWPLVHDVAQVPHADSVVLRFVSQPFVALPSQFANRLLQAPIWQTPLKHVAPALA